MKFVVRCGEAVAPTGCVLSSFADDFAVLLMIDQPVFGSFQYGDFVTFKAATTAEDEFATIYRVFFESLDHFCHSMNSIREFY